MRAVVDPGDEQTETNADQGEQAGSQEQPAELTGWQRLPLAPEESQQRAVDAENGPGGPAGNGLVSLHHQRQQIAGQAAADINCSEAGAAIGSFDQLPAVPQRPEVHAQMQYTKVQEQRAAEAPPLAILGRRPEVRTPGQLDTILPAMPQAGTGAEHQAENQQVGDDQQHRHRHPGLAGVQSVVQRDGGGGGGGHRQGWA